VGGRIIVRQEKISRAKRGWTNQLNAPQETIHYAFIKFCYHSGCDSTVLFDQTNNRSNDYLGSSRFWTATSLSSSASSLPSRNREYHLKTFDPFTASFTLAFCTNTRVSAADSTVLKQNFIATLCSFPPAMTYKENWRYKTSYNSYTVENKQNSVCERMLVESSVGREIALVVKKKKKKRERERESLKTWIALHCVYQAAGAARTRPLNMLRASALCFRNK
jgi:hypothetical protein